MKKSNILKLTVLSILIALTLIFQAFATQFKVGTYSLPLSLVVIAVGAILYGPGAGLLLGTVWGTYIYMNDGSVAVFATYSIPYTLIAVIGRGALNGLLTGLIYQLFKHLLKFKGGDTAAMFIASMLIPFINKGIFTLCEYLMFKDLLLNKFGVENVWAGFLSLNLVITCLSSFVLSPVVVRVCIAGRHILRLDEEKESLKDTESINEDNLAYDSVNSNNK